MGVKTKCEGCSKTVNAPDTFAGKTSNCPKCGGTLRFPAAAPVDDLFDDLIPEAPKVSTMPPEPPAEMQPVSLRDKSQGEAMFAGEVIPEPAQKPIEISYPPDGLPVMIKRIKIPLSDALMLIITFWVASLIIAFCLFILGTVFGAALFTAAPRY